MQLNNLAYLASNGALIHNSSLSIDGGIFVSASPTLTSAVIIDLENKYIAIPTFTGSIVSVSSSAAVPTIANALENGVETIAIDYRPTDTTKPSYQFGKWETLFGLLSSSPSLSAASLVHSLTTRRIAAGNPASFILLKSTSIDFAIKHYNYKSTIQAVIINGKFKVARGELLSRYAAQATLSSYYEIEGSQHREETVGDSDEYVLNSIPEAIQDVKDGKFVIVVDNMDRENEGDLIIAAEDVTSEKMAFMIKHTGLSSLCLPMMVDNNQDTLKTAYTISLDYKHGTTTGISAHDRASTVRGISDPTKSAEDFQRPGHVFPLRYVEGGVLSRVGHTEASVDLCVLAGKRPCAAISEIVSCIGDMGGMARRDELFRMSKVWGIKMVSIADLVNYIKSNE